MTPTHLINLRTTLNWTQTRAAEYLDISLRQYQRYESGHRIPRTVQICMSMAQEQNHAAKENQA